jgi:hypothetical protein
MYARGAGTPEDLRWFWSITVYVDPRAGIVTSGKVPTLEEAKARFRTIWERVKAHMAAKNIDHAEPDPRAMRALLAPSGRP